MKIAVINGPNLNLLGKREPDIYGAETLADTIAALRARFPDVEISHFQSNSEGALIDALHDYGYRPDMAGIVLNPGAYAHYSLAIADAIRAIPAPVVEVHISNIHARETFRQRSVTAEASKAIISGCGRTGYELAMEFLIKTHGL